MGALVWSQPARLTWLAGKSKRSTISANIIDSCRKGCGITNEEWLLLGGVQAASTIAAALGAASNPVAAALTVGALLGVAGGYAGCLVQCAWYTPDCFTPSVCQQIRIAYPEIEYFVAHYCEFGEADQKLIDNFCNSAYRNTFVQEEPGFKPPELPTPLPEPTPTPTATPQKSLWSPLLIGLAMTGVALVAIYTVGNK